MSTITVPRADVTAELVTEVLRSRLGTRYTITPGKHATGFGKEVQGDANSVLVAGNWLERSTVTIASDENSTDIEVSPGATYFGLIRLAHRVGLTHKVHNVLAQAPELAASRTQ
jgi:hypothetical protein